MTFSCVEREDQLCVVVRPKPVASRSCNLDVDIKKRSSWNGYIFNVEPTNNNVTGYLRYEGIIPWYEGTKVTFYIF